jgi:hypothetical protein
VNVVPVADVATEQRPPCPFAIASTIAKPSPTPPCSRLRAESERAKRSKIRSRASSGIPQPPSSTEIAIQPPASRTAESSTASPASV